MGSSDSGRVVVERATLRLHPQLEQESWSWSETRGEQLIRSYEVDLKTGKAVATRVDQHKRWIEDLKIEPGTFAEAGSAVSVTAAPTAARAMRRVPLRICRASCPLAVL